LAPPCFCPPAWANPRAPAAWKSSGVENSLDLSGIATSNGTRVLVASDESFYIQPGEIDRAKRRIESRSPIPLPVRKTRKAEADIEGVAFSHDDQAYYAVGSHGLGKKKGDFQPDRHSICRIPVDPATGLVRKDAIRRTSLLPWLEKTPLLAPYVRKPLQQNGLNIEGLTWSGGKLFFGLRAPNAGGRGVIIEIAPGEIFGGKPRALTVHEIAIPKDRGFREIVALKEGFILLTGNASAEASKKIPVTMAAGPDTRFDLLYWPGTGAGRAEKIGTLPDNGGKAEALLVLEETAGHADVLVIFDGLQGGQPVLVRIRR
jgi:hypothetical protein